MPCNIRGQVDVFIDRGEDGTLFVSDSSGNVIYSPVVARDDEVIQWAINYVDEDYISKSLKYIFDIRGEIS